MTLGKQRITDRPWWVGVRERIEARSPFLWVFVPLAVIYLLTASLTSFTHIDPMTNALTGWHLGMTGSVVMPDHAAATAPEQVGNVGWIVESPRGPVSQYPPGAAALSAPLYWLWDEPMTPALVTGLNRPGTEGIPFPLPSPLPAAIVASLTAAAAMGLLASTISYAGGTRLAGVAAGFVGGLGTTMWAVAADSLWQHGPAAMWIALAIFLTARQRLAWAGLAFGAAALTRPHLASIAVVMILYLGLSRRTFKPVLQIGAGTLLGLGGLLIFNWWLWGTVSISGGYQGGFTEQFLAPNAGAFVSNVVGAVIDPARGLLPYSPFLLFLVPGIGRSWRAVPDWSKAAALGGLVYLLIQLKANRFSGGDGFLGYRYPLEALTAAGTFLVFAYVSWTRERPLMKNVFWLMVVVAVVLQVNSQIS